MTRASGLFITFEGGEGSGKTTQVNRLAAALTGEGRKVVTTREPGGTPEGEKIRELLVQREGGNWNPLAETLMLYAARAMHVETLIEPALERGKIVISDRFFDSTYAYQGAGRGLDAKAIGTIQNLSIGDFCPDLTIIMDIDPDKGLKRSGRRLAAEVLDIRQSEDRFERMEIDFHQRLRASYLGIAKAEPARCRIVDAAQDPDAVAAAVIRLVREKLGA